MTGLGEARVHRRLIDTLYAEAMLLADEARGYFEDAGRGERDALAPLERVTFACESLKVTTRLMHVIAWLLTQRAILAGELAPGDARDPARRLGTAAAPGEGVETLPATARALVAASAELHRRVTLIDAAQVAAAAPSPAHLLQSRLAAAF